MKFVEYLGDKESERPREHVGAAAGQCRHDGVGADQPVGGLVDGAVAAEDDDEVGAGRRGALRES